MLMVRTLLVLLLQTLVQVQTAPNSSPAAHLSNATANRAGGKLQFTLTRSKRNCTAHHCKYQKVADKKDSSAAKQKRSASGVATLYDEAYGTFWMCAIYVGSLQQLFYVDLDTGSSDVWVPSQSCTTCGGTHRFNPASSTTYKACCNVPFYDSYGSGAVLGTWGTDTFTLAGLSVTNLPFGIINAAAGFSDAADGLMGLGYQSLSSGDFKPFVWIWYSSGQLALPVFCFWFGPVSTGSDTGVMDLGVIDSSRYTGSITYASVTHQGFWQFTVDSFRLSTSTTNIETQFQAILDTGTTLIIAPTAYAASINKAIGGTYSSQNGLYLVNCKSPLSSFPNFIFTISGVQFTLTPGMYLQYATLSNGQYVCYSLLAPGTATDMQGNPVWILGDAYMRHFYSVFNMQNNAVGLAVSSASPNTPTFPKGVFSSSSG